MSGTNKARSILIDRTIENIKNKCLYRYREDIEQELASLEHLNDAQRDKYFKISSIAYMEGMEDLLNEIGKSNMEFMFTS